MRKVTFSILTLLCVTPVLAAGNVSRLLPGESPKNSSDVVSRTAPVVSDTASETSGRAGRLVGERGGTDKNTERTAVTRSIVRGTVSSGVKKNDAATTTRSVNRANAVTRSLTVSDTARSNVESAARNVGRSPRTDAASINNNPAVRRMGLTLRPSTAEVGGRAIIGDTGLQTGSNIASEIRNVQSRASVATKKLDAQAIADARDQIEKEAELNLSCQEMYNNCMDQFCAVVDANQKRCSCSANLSKYNKVEAAVKEANAKLNEVAQNIRYVGLSADEISAILSATEAEEALSNTTDKTESRNMLAQIEKMIKDPSVSASSYDTDAYGMLDIDLDFSSSDVSDLFNLDFLGGNSAKSFSNLRGSDLYSAAKKRCDTVLKQCKNAGATENQITGNYDLAIDKDCLAYENGLNKMNETLVSNVRSANRMLQKARLAVLQNQNTYDARECIGALETCMTDDMVCGTDYVKCLDPTKKYIDENGNVVLGQNINNIQKFMSEYNNANIDFSAASNTQISDSTCGNDGKCVVKYLLDKIGTGQKVSDGGLCRPVLDKCRTYTYDDKAKYKPYNEVVQNFIQRAMVNIKAGQYRIVSDYASTCLNDLADCYNQQVTQLNSWTTSANQTDVYNVVRGACRNVALTCAYAVFANDSDSCPTPDPSSDTTSNETAETTCLRNISIMFDPTVSCPANSYYVGNSQGEVGNYQCICNNGYVAVNGRNECQECATFFSWSDQNDYVCRQNNSDNRQQTTGGSGNNRAATVQNSRALTLSPTMTLAQLNAFPTIIGEYQFQLPYICTANYSRLDITDTNNDRFSGKCTCPTTLQWDRMTNTCASASTN